MHPWPTDRTNITEICKYYISQFKNCYLTFHLFIYFYWNQCSAFWDFFNYTFSTTRTAYCFLIPSIYLNISKNLMKRTWNVMLLIGLWFLFYPFSMLYYFIFLLVTNTTVMRSKHKIHIFVKVEHICFTFGWIPT